MFPDTQDLELVAQAAWGADVTTSPSTWVWTDLTCPHPSIPTSTISRLLATPITIKRGVVVGGSSKATTTATLHLLNADGAFTPFLTSSPYFPNVDAGTPVRLGVRYQPAIVDTFNRTTASGWGTSDSGDAWTPAGVTISSTSGGQGQITYNAVNSSRGLILNRAMRDVDVVFDTAVNAVQAGFASEVGMQLRRNTAGTNRIQPYLILTTSGTVQIRVYRYLGGTPTTLTTVTVPGLTYAAGTMIRCRIQVESTAIRARAWLAANAEPTTWTVNITDTLVSGPGETMVIGSTVYSTNTNTLPTVFTVDNVTITQIPSWRLQGYITDVRPTFLPQSDGSTWSTVLVDVGGVGSRLEKNQAPAYSPLRRSVQLAALTPLAYWPLEDPEGSVTGASAFPGQPPMTVTGPAVFAFGTGVPDDIFQSRYGTKPMVSVAAGARLTAPVPLSVVTTEWALSFVGQFYTPDIPGVTELRIIAWDTPGGTFNRWALVGTGTGYQLRGYNDTLGTVTNAFTDTFGVYAAQLSYTIEAQQVGSNISVQVFYNGNSFQAATSVAGTMAPITRVIVNPDRTNTTAALTPRGLRFIMGHVRVVDETFFKDLPTYTDPITGTVRYAGNAWYLESAHERIKRLCAEERVPVTVLGNPAVTGYTQLNSQRDGSFSTLVEQAAESESGMLVYEDGFGYAVLPRTARYNQTPALTVDLATYRRLDDTDQADILVPQLESRASNYWTVNRAGGSSGTFAADPAYRKRRGTIVEEVTIDALTDTVLADHAAWRTHLNVDYTGAFYPTIQVDLAANPGLIDAWLQCAPGSRVQRLNQPTIAGVGTIDQVIDGFSETIGPKLWRAEIAGSPAEVWNVGVYDTGLYDAATTTVGGAGLTASATSVTFSSTNKGDTWSTTPGYKVLVNGERMVVTAMGAQTGSGPWTQAATVTRSDNGVVRAHPAGTQIHVDNPLRWAL